MTFGTAPSAADEEEPARSSDLVSDRSSRPESEGSASDWFGAPDVLALAFRDVLTALAQPASPRRLSRPAPPLPPMSAAAATTLRVLADADAPVWLAPSRATDAISAFVRFHLGGAPIAAPERATFAVGRWDELAERPFLRGTPERPDLSATAIVEVDGFGAGEAARLSGPGLAAPTTLAVAGVDARFWPTVAENALTFPLGLDIVLASEDWLVGLPRSLRATPLGRIEEAG